MTTQTTTAPAPTAAAQLAAAQFANVVPAMTSAIKVGKAIAYGLVVAVLLATYPHVGMFLDDYVGALGWVFPAIFGVGLLAFYHVAQTPGLIVKGRRRAYAVVALCGAGELSMQAAASHSVALGALFVGVVLVGLAAKWAAAAIKPDLTVIAAAEATAAAQAAQLAPAAPTADELAAAKRSAAAIKGAETRRRKAAEAAAAAKVPAQRKARTPKAPKLPEAPVSGAPGAHLSARDDRAFAAMTAGLILDTNVAAALADARRGRR